MRIVRVHSNGILFRVLPEKPIKVWIRRTEVTRVLSQATLNTIEALIPPPKEKLLAVTTMSDLDGLMREAKATNESLALAAGYDRNTVARARGGAKVLASTAETLYQTLKERSFNYKKRGRLRHGEISL